MIESILTLHNNVQFEESLELQELSFDEPCDYYYDENKHTWQECGTRNFPKEIFTTFVKRPLFQQAFKFFREKYKLKGDVHHSNSNGTYTYTIWKWNNDNTIGNWERISIIGSWNTYEEAQSLCLKRLISLVK